MQTADCFRVQRLSVLAGLVATALIIVVSSSGAQGWPPSVEKLTCTESFPICIEQGNPKDQCTITYQRCPKTGRWVGSVSGRDYGPRIKR